MIRPLDFLHLLKPRIKKTINKFSQCPETGKYDLMDSTPPAIYLPSIQLVILRSLLCALVVFLLFSHHDPANQFNLSKRISVCLFYFAGLLYLVIVLAVKNYRPPKSSEENEMPGLMLGGILFQFMFNISVVSKAYIEATNTSSTATWNIVCIITAHVDMLIANDQLCFIAKQIKRRQKGGEGKEEAVNDVKIPIQSMPTPRYDPGCYYVILFALSIAFVYCMFLNKNEEMPYHLPARILFSLLFLFDTIYFLYRMIRGRPQNKQEMNRSHHYLLRLTGKRIVAFCLLPLLYFSYFTNSILWGTVVAYGCNVVACIYLMWDQQKFFEEQFKSTPKPKKEISQKERKAMTLRDIRRKSLEISSEIFDLLLEKREEELDRLKMARREEKI